MEKIKSAGFCAKVVSINIETRINQAIQKYDITLSQSRVLSYIVRNADKVIFARDVEAFFMLKHPTVTGLLQRLEEKDLIAIEQDSSDKRFKRLLPTQAGVDVHNSVRQMIDSIENEMFSCLSGEEYGLLTDMMNKVIENSCKRQKQDREEN